MDWDDFETPEGVEATSPDRGRGESRREGENRGEKLRRSFDDEQLSERLAKLERTVSREISDLRRDIAALSETLSQIAIALHQQPPSMQPSSSSPPQPQQRQSQNWRGGGGGGGGGRFQPQAGPAWRRISGGTPPSLPQEPTNSADLDHRGWWPPAAIRPCQHQSPSGRSTDAPSPPQQQ